MNKEDRAAEEAVSHPGQSHMNRDDYISTLKADIIDARKIAEEQAYAREAAEAKCAAIQAQVDDLKRQRAGVSRAYDNEVEKVATLRASLDATRMALEIMVEEKCDYMRINLLGDPEKQHTVKIARAALSDPKEPK